MVQTCYKLGSNRKQRRTHSDGKLRKASKVTINICKVEAGVVSKSSPTPNIATWGGAVMHLKGGKSGSITGT